MPVRSLTSPVLIWPNHDQVDQEVRSWGVAPKASTPAAVRVGYFGSYARGDRGVGSDLDVVVIMTECGLPPERRGTAFDTITGLPVPVDLLVYTEAEWEQLRADRASFIRGIEAEAVWVA
jgi:predicted nucleotidyltransferase